MEWQTELLGAVNKVTWRDSTYHEAHQYVEGMWNEDCAHLFMLARNAILEHGDYRPFTMNTRDGSSVTIRWKYLDIGDHTYWVMRRFLKDDYVVTKEDIGGVNRKPKDVAAQ